MLVQICLLFIIVIAVNRCFTPAPFIVKQKTVFERIYFTRHFAAADISKQTADYEFAYTEDSLVENMHFVSMFNTSVQCDIRVINSTDLRKLGIISAENAINAYCVTESHCVQQEIAAADCELLRLHIQGDVKNNLINLAFVMAGFVVMQHIYDQCCRNQF